jgi:hypothetical protein
LCKHIKIKVYKTVIVLVVLCGCESWSITLGEEHRLRVLEDRVLSKIFVAKQEEVTGDLRKLLTEELHDLYSSSNIIRVIQPRRMMWVGHVTFVGDMTGAHRVLVGTPEVKTPLERPRCRWERNIKMNL